MLPSEPEQQTLRRLQSVWENHAKEDPLWAIASLPDKMGRKWDLAELLQTGTHEIDQLMKTLASSDIDFDPTSALDFGCGVGRLTQALARNFKSVCGVDISPTMIKTAERLAGKNENCRFYVNAREDLRLFKDEEFSFVYSNIVLQHIPPPVSMKYLAEFARILKRDGLLVFQLPARFMKEAGLPAAAWHASLSCEEQTFTWPASSAISVPVRVRNASPVVWQYEPRTPIMLGNHWLDGSGRMIRQDDGRAVLPNALAPGKEIFLTLQMKTPPSPGTYKLEFDLVQESVAWFKDKGSPSLELPVEIVAPVAEGRGGRSVPEAKPTEAGGAEGSPGASAFEGFSMYYIPRSKVVDLLYRHGLRLEFIEPSSYSGPGYQSYVYFARKCLPA
jgi:ubiquinone/menaquinone biosynthesis C-methylase UbiE